MLYYCLGPLLAVLFMASPSTTPKRHCQVPCGIYGDMMRVSMTLEDAATIEKGMAQIGELAKAGALNYNQIVRWVNAKDEHAQAIQDRVAAYWLAQRVKRPKTDDEAAWKKYRKQLELMHGITVAAMKCKQTTDKAHVAAIRAHIKAFSETYFSKKDLDHLKDHHK